MFTMFRLPILFIINIIIFKCIASQFINTNPAVGEYGPYTVDFYNYTICGGGDPAKNAATFSSTLVKKDGHYKAFINITTFAPTPLDYVRSFVYKVKENRKIQLWNQRIVKPCRHFAIAQISQQILNNTNCIAKKGTYTFELDFTELTYLFYGTSFFYGNYYMKSFTQAKKGFILCIAYEFVFKKKT